MLPETIFQLDYQDYAKLVENNLNEISKYQTDNNIRFDLILAKLRNGVFASSIVSSNLHIPMGTIEVNDNKDIDLEDIYIPKDVRNKINENINVLIIDSICNTGETIKKIKDFFTFKYPNIKITTYCTLVYKDSNTKPDITGLFLDKYIQTPWERYSYTPQANLDKLENGINKTKIIDSFYIGVCSENCNDEIKEFLPKKDDKHWYAIFHYENENINMPSSISARPIDNNINLKESKKLYKNYLKEKINFIQENGITHFIEDNLAQAILLSEECPICHISYYSENSFYKIYAKSQDKKTLFII